MSTTDISEKTEGADENGNLTALKTMLTEKDIFRGATAGEFLDKVLADVKQKNCVLIMAILKGVDQDKIGSTILKSLTAESAENKQNK